jgi:hypothetical protein
MRFISILLKLLLTTFTGLFFGFFVIGFFASNNFESEPDAIISSGALAKVFIVPIGLVAGTLFVASLGYLIQSLSLPRTINRQPSNGSVKSHVKDVHNSGRQTKVGLSDFDQEKLADYVIEIFDYVFEFYRPLRILLWSDDLIERFPPVTTPVGRGRILLVSAFNRSRESDSRASSRQLIQDACGLFATGAVHPQHDEWFIDGPEVGRANACMWNGIARALMHRHAPDIQSVDLSRSDTWFGMAAVLFVECEEQIMVGRVLSEWAESRRLSGDIEGGDLLFTAAAATFLAAGDSDRSQTIARRIGEHNSTHVDSSFFLGRPPTVDEASILATVLGGKNTQALYEAMD